MHRPVLFNKTFTMKREDLFAGAIVLAKELDCKKRTRHEVVEIYETSVKLRSRMKYNSFFYASIEHLKPAKITLKDIKKLDFRKERKSSSTWGCYRRGAMEIWFKNGKLSGIWWEGYQKSMKKAYVHNLQRLTLVETRARIDFGKLLK